MQQSEGAELHPFLETAGIDFIVHKGENPLFDSYSAFFDNGQRQQTPVTAG